VMFLAVPFPMLRTTMLVRKYEDTCSDVPCRPGRRRLADPAGAVDGALGSMRGAGGRRGFEARWRPPLLRGGALVGAAPLCWTELAKDASSELRSGQSCELRAQGVLGTSAKGPKITYKGAATLLEAGFS
jgi:hypothetical protein